jgi:hypothetical protein
MSRQLGRPLAALSSGVVIFGVLVFGARVGVTHTGRANRPLYRLNPAGDKRLNALEYYRISHCILQSLVGFKLSADINNG